MRRLLGWNALFEVRAAANAFVAPRTCKKAHLYTSTSARGVKTAAFKPSAGCLTQ